MPKDKRPPGDDDEVAAFAEAVRGVRKLAGPRRVSLAVGARDGPLVSRVSPRVKIPVPPTMSSPPWKDTNEDTGEIWTARADGVDRRIFRKLRRGEIPVEARVDLHGLTRANAARALARFMTASRGADHRCLLVIHGRGLHSGGEGAALRELVRRELTAAAHTGAVLACGTAAPCQGGPGATVVYLRR
jgi:DNA-nicking Smr family endonuclease